MAEDDDTQQSPFARPGFIIGAVVVAALIVAGIFLTVLNLNREPDAAPPAPDPSSSATTRTAASLSPAARSTGAASRDRPCSISASRNSVIVAAWTQVAV